MRAQNHFFDIFLECELPGKTTIEAHEWMSVIVFKLFGLELINAIALAHLPGDLRMQIQHSNIRKQGGHHHIDRLTKGGKKTEKPGISCHCRSTLDGSELSDG